MGLKEAKTTEGRLVIVRAIASCCVLAMSASASASSFRNPSMVLSKTKPLNNVLPVAVQKKALCLSFATSIPTIK
jgi:hypothetical protein